MVRPSLNSNARVSSVTFTSSTNTLHVSTSEFFIPSLQQRLFVILDDSLDMTKFVHVESNPFRELYGGQPKLCFFPFPSNVNVRRFMKITGVKKESVRSNP
jgi:hypothetical protein